MASVAASGAAVGGSRRAVPSVLHLDMDAFYASVEQRHKPSLRGKPVIVGGVGGRGVVSTASYEARAFGVRSATPTALARRRCPHAAFLIPRFGAYSVVSQVVMALLREVSPLVEPLSLDEAFVDLNAMPDGPPRDAERVREVARRLRARIVEVTGLTASVGAGTSKLIAKVASDADKPDGLVVVPRSSEQDWLDPLPVRALWGVGPATADRLRGVGVATVAELRALSAAELVRLLGQAHGSSLYALARGYDDRPVEGSRELKSVSVEDTFATDIVDAATLRAEMTRLVARMAVRLRQAGRTGRTVTIKVRAHDFTTITRSETFPGPSDDERVLRAAALRLLEQATEVIGGGVRLLGVGMSALAEFAQGDLFSEPEVAGDDPDDPDADAASRDQGTDTDRAAGSGDTPGRRDTQFGPLPERASPWRPGQDVTHDEFGPGWVQGTGLGLVTVRFEGPDDLPGRVRTLPVGDPALRPGDDGAVARSALRDPPEFGSGGEVTSDQAALENDGR
jgi:DNA polymerase-4